MFWMLETLSKITVKINTRVNCLQMSYMKVNYLSWLELRQEYILDNFVYFYHLHIIVFYVNVHSVMP